MRYLHKRWLTVACLSLALAFGIGFGTLSAGLHSSSIPAGMLAEDPGTHTGGGG